MNIYFYQIRTILCCECCKVTEGDVCWRCHLASILPKTMDSHPINMHVWERPALLSAPPALRSSRLLELLLLLYFFQQIKHEVHQSEMLQA